MVVEYPRVHFGEMVEDVEMEQRQAFVHEALLHVEAGIDPRSIGAAVTIALCGHYEHEGVCRWPHNNDICTDTSPARFRTLFVSDARDEPDVRERITRALSQVPGISLTALFPRPVTESEHTLAARLLRVDRRGS
jgi:hypothetical protein